MNINIKRLLVDMDGVLADIYQQYIKMEYARSGRLVKLEEITGLQEAEAFRGVPSFCMKKAFFVIFQL